MIAAWMLYCVGIGLAFVIAGRAMEWALHLAGRQTRWAWGVALAGTLLVPAAAWLLPEAFSTVAVPIPARTGQDPVAVTPTALATQPGVPVTQLEAAFSLSDLDAALGWGWGLSSAALGLVLIVAAIRLAVLRRRWRAAFIDGRSVLVSENVGPAVTGLWRPWIVVPGWALQLTERQRELMLAHEEEHVRAGDHRLLAWGALALALAPWNPALWWQSRRLRLAVEMDCDARVLSRAEWAPEYGELLLQVSRRRAQLALGAPALGEPVSFLERRIRRMATALPRWRWLGAAAGLTVAAGAIIAACEAPRPAEPEAPSTIARTVRERMDLVMARADSAMAEKLRPWIAENIKRFYPELLQERSGPPVEVWFGHDARLRVSAAYRMTPPSRTIDAARISSVFRTFRPGNDGWSVVDRRALRGLVRDNVRVIMVHLGALNRERDLSAFDEHPEMLVLPWIAEGIKRHYPTLLRERTGPPVELWFVADPGKQVLRTLQRAGSESIRVGIEEIHAVFPDLDASNVEGWRLAQGRGLGRLVRDNVRVIWIQLRPGATEKAGASQEPADKPAELVSAPQLRYPELLRLAGIEGAVIVQGMVGSDGRVEPGSVKVIESAHPGFDEAAKEYVLGALFRPARTHGQAVRAVTNVPVEFTL